MKTLKKLFDKMPSYTKKGSDYLAEKTGLKYKTVERYKKSTEFIESKKAYLQEVSTNKKNKLINE